MNSMKEIIKICTGDKVAKWLRKQNSGKGDSFYCDKMKNSIETIKDYCVPEWWFWLPISFDTKHGCLQVEYLLMKKLGIKSLYMIKVYFNDWVQDKCQTDKEIKKMAKKSYTLQCLYWLRELINDEDKC